MIAIDAMGGDLAPKSVVKGAYNAAQSGIAVMLFGDEVKITKVLDATSNSWKKLPITVSHCESVVGMGDDPVRAISRKKDSSLVCSVKSVRAQVCRAIVSAGNSGALLVAGAIILGKTPQVLRPAIGQFFPTKRGSVFCLDLGVNVDCKPQYLQQFAVIGSEYVKMVQGVKAPKVALLSNGHEPYKGSSLTKEAYSLLLHDERINFIGNMESRDMFEGHADVLVSDGFVGNVLLKTAQGTATFLKHAIGCEVKKLSFIKKFFLRLGGASNLLKILQKRTDYAVQGGALLLGVQKPMVIAHGCSNEKAIENAIRFAYTIDKEGTVDAFNKRIADILSEGGEERRNIFKKMYSSIERIIKK